MPIEIVDKKDLKYSSLKNFCFGDEIKQDLFVTVRELGGAIAPLWPSYIGSTSKESQHQNFIFLVDSADPGRLAEAGVHLVDCLSSLEECKHRCKLLLILTKVDLLNAGQRGKQVLDILSLLQIGTLTAWCHHVKLQVLEYSAGTGEGIDTIVDWLKGVYYHPL